LTTLPVRTGSVNLSRQPTMASRVVRSAGSEVSTCQSGPNLPAGPANAPQRWRSGMNAYQPSLRCGHCARCRGPVTMRDSARRYSRTVIPRCGRWLSRALEPIHLMSTIIRRSPAIPFAVLPRHRPGVLPPGSS
jgi:hypothetical protein